MFCLTPRIFFLIIWIILIAKTYGVKVATSGYHVIHNDNPLDAFNGFQFVRGNAPRYHSPAPVPVPFTLALQRYV